jgi:integrase
LDVGDFHVDDRILEIRGTKFFKSRHLPLSGSVCAALCSYLDLRKQAGGPINPAAPLLWHSERVARYSYGMARTLLIPILRRAGLKPLPGRVGARIHDLRHAFVVNRMLAWYRDGINPQSRLPYLATYLAIKTSTRHSYISPLPKNYSKRPVKGSACVALGFYDLR